jgi:hypoxia up-regulated 1
MLPVVLVGTLLGGLQTVSAAVLAIDYGTGWTKAALVKPGIPLEIVLTKDTKRKEQSVIAFK